MQDSNNLQKFHNMVKPYKCGCKSLLHLIVFYCFCHENLCNHTRRTIPRKIIEKSLPES